MRNTRNIENVPVSKIPVKSHSPNLIHLTIRYRQSLNSFISQHIKPVYWHLATILQAEQLSAFDQILDLAIVEA